MCGGTEENTNFLFYPFMHSLVNPCMCPDQGSNHNPGASGQCSNQQNYPARAPSLLDLLPNFQPVSFFFVILSSSCLNLKLFFDTCFSFISYIHQSAQLFTLLFTVSRFVLGFCIAYYLPFLTLVSFLEIYSAYGCQNNFPKTFLNPLVLNLSNLRREHVVSTFALSIVPSKVN